MWLIRIVYTVRSVIIIVRHRHTGQRPALSTFLDDVRSQAQVLRALIEAYRGELRPLVVRAAELVERRPDRPILVLGMGSSLSAGRILPAVLARRKRVVVLEDAGELLHYGLGAAERAGVIVAISQSGRSFETVRAVEALRAGDDAPVVVLVNEASSPLAEAGDVVLPLLAGHESAIATKTYLAAMTALLLVAAEGAPDLLDPHELERAIDAVQVLALDQAIGPRAAGHLARARSIMIVGRGPSLGAATYGALTIKEAAAIPAEGMSGGAFRHGPVELTEGEAGVVVLAPGGRTTGLLVGIAQETAARGAPTWLITDPVNAPTSDSGASLLVSPVLPSLPEEVAPLALAVPLQLAADALARQVGRSAGVTTVATKVTDRE